MNIFKKFIENRNMIRLPRKVKKRYKKMYAERLGMPPHKLKMMFTRRDYKIIVELKDGK